MTQRKGAALVLAALIVLGCWFVGCVHREATTSRGADETSVKPATEAAPWRGRRIPGPPAVWNERGEHIGVELCDVCHPEVVAEFVAAPHARLMGHADEDSFGCEACHGPGQSHEEDDESRFIDDFPRLGLAEVAERCSRCHFEDLRYFDRLGQHQVVLTRPCTECHGIHPGTTPVAAVTAMSAIERADQACGECHPSAVEAHLDSNHARLVRGPHAIGCGGCHGAGDEHVRSGGKAGTIARPSRAVQEQLCRACHAKTRELAGWRLSSHHRGDVGCLSCHDLLQPGGTRTRKPETELCQECHPSQVADFQAQFHHPVPEGVMQCSSCHDVHRDRPSVLGNRDMDRRCKSCHPTTAGPFVYEHEADRTEGCAACHVPHGSPNPRLLTMWPVRNLCLSCHPATPLNHNLASFSPFRACVSCHSEIHGSDTDRRFWR